MPFAATERLVERDRELEALGSLLGQAVDGEGGVAIVEGPPGIGKTRLLEGARERAAERGLSVLTARGGELEREIPFGIVRQLYERRVARADAAGTRPCTASTG